MVQWTTCENKKHLKLTIYPTIIVDISSYLLLLSVSIYAREVSVEIDRVGCEEKVLLPDPIVDVLVLMGLERRIA